MSRRLRQLRGRLRFLLLTRLIGDKVILANVKIATPEGMNSVYLANMEVGGFIWRCYIGADPDDAKALIEHWDGKMPERAK